MLDVVTFTVSVKLYLVGGYFCTIKILELCSWVEDPFEGCLAGPKQPLGANFFALLRQEFSDCSI